MAETPYEPGAWERVVLERQDAVQRNLSGLQRWADGAAPDDRAEATRMLELLAAGSLRALDTIARVDLPLARLVDEGEDCDG